MVGYVYFAKFADTVKVGYSHDLAARMRDLTRCAQVPGTFLGRIQTSEKEARLLERWFHQRWSRFRIRGEWFAADPILLGEVRHIVRHPERLQQEVDAARRLAKSADRPPAAPFRVIARLARDVVQRNQEAPDCELGALADEVKCACAQYHIPYDSDVVARALRSELWKVRGYRV